MGEEGGVMDVAPGYCIIRSLCLSYFFVLQWFFILFLPYFSLGRHWTSSSCPHIGLNCKLAGPKYIYALRTSSPSRISLPLSTSLLLRLLHPPGNQNLPLSVSQIIMNALHLIFHYLTFKSEYGFSYLTTTFQTYGFDFERN